MKFYKIWEGYYQMKKILADNNDDNWIKAFNKYTGSSIPDVKIGEIVTDNHPALHYVDEFNHTVAEGPAINYSDV